MIRLREDGTIRFSGGIEIAVEHILRYFKIKPYEFEAFLLYKLKEAVKRPKK